MNNSIALLLIIFSTPFELFCQSTNSCFETKIQMRSLSNDEISSGIISDLDPFILLKEGAIQVAVNSTDSSCFYGIFIVNNSPKDTLIQVQDGKIAYIQEALDYSDSWQPIEYWVQSDCGNSYYSLPLLAKHYIKLKGRKYEGKVKTQSRFKVLWNDSTIHYSNIFEIGINNEQLIQKDEKEKSDYGYSYLNIKPKFNGDSIEYLKQILKEDVHSGMREKSEACYLLSCFYFEKKEYNLSEKYLNKAIILDSEIKRNARLLKVAFKQAIKKEEKLYLKNLFKNYTLFKDIELLDKLNW